MPLFVSEAIVCFVLTRHNKIVSCQEDSIWKITTPKSWIYSWNMTPLSPFIRGTTPRRIQVSTLAQFRCSCSKRRAIGSQQAPMRRGRHGPCRHCQLNSDIAELPAHPKPHSAPIVVCCPEYYFVVRSSAW